MPRAVFHTDGEVPCDFPSQCVSFLSNFADLLYSCYFPIPNNIWSPPGCVRNQNSVLNSEEILFTGKLLKSVGVARHLLGWGEGVGELGYLT